MLLHIPDVLTAHDLAAIHAGLRQAEWQGGQAAASPDAARIVQAALARSALFFAAALPVRSLPPLFQCTESGQHAPLDAIGALRRGPDGTLLRADVGATLFLSGPGDYDGGELLVNDSYGEHEVKLAAGDLVVYGAASPRRVTPVTRGTRLSAVFATQSMVSDDVERAMLFDLDRTIQALRARIGDGEETVSLTSHYHNLLRHWART